MALSGLVVAACAQIINADFDNLKPRSTTASTSTGMAGSGEGGGAGAGGTDTGAAGDMVDASGGSSGGGAAGSGGGVGGSSPEASADASGSDGGREAGPDVVDSGHPDSEPDRSMPTDAPTMDHVAVDDAPDVVVEDGGDASIVGGLVINELNAQGALEDYIELYNGGTTAFDLSQYSVAQATSTGMPETGTALKFASGTMLAPNEYILIVANQDTQPAGGPMACTIPGFSGDCYIVPWGISKNGDRVYLLAADDSPLQMVDFPPPGATQPPTGRSYGRFPNGTGPFQSTVWTPGKENLLQ
jgi:hypothetical protein